MLLTITVCSCGLSAPHGFTLASVLDFHRIQCDPPTTGDPKYHQSHDLPLRENEWKPCRYGPGLCVEASEAPATSATMCSSYGCSCQSKCVNNPIFNGFLTGGADM